jgi:putative transposase
MIRKYKFHNPDGLYFVSFATIYWIDVFVRKDYFSAVADSLNYCRKNKGMELYAYCIMPSHLHLIFRDSNENPGKLLREFKTYTSKKLIELIEENIQESRQEWMLWMFKRAGSKNSVIKEKQFWQQHTKPIELWSNKVIQEKLDYIRINPVEAGFVTEPHYWNGEALTEGNYSSAANYCGGNAVFEIDLLI